MINNIAGILLASGKSTRFGDNKLLQHLPQTQTPVIIQSAKNLLNALPNCVAVIRKNDNTLKQLLSSLTLEICENPYAEEGIASSIRTGIQYLQEQQINKPLIKGYVIALADMPFIPADIIKSVAVELTKDKLICTPRYKGQRGHPVGFSATLGNELLKLQGDFGAKIIISEHQKDVHFIDVSTEGILTDVDYPSDLSR